MEQTRRGVGSQTQQGLVAIGRRLSDPGFTITFLAMEARLVGVCSVAKVKEVAIQTHPCWVRSLELQHIQYDAYTCIYLNVYFI